MGAEDALAALAKILDPALVAEVDQRLRIDLGRSIPREEQVLFLGRHVAADARADHEEQVTLPGGNEGPVPTVVLPEQDVGNEGL